MSKRALQVLEDARQCFTQWPDMLPEMQLEVAGQLDPYSRQALAMTSNSHHVRWDNPQLHGDLLLTGMHLAPQTPLSYIELAWEKHAAKLPVEFILDGRIDNHVRMCAHFVGCLAMSNETTRALALGRQLLERCSEQDIYCTQHLLGINVVRSCNQLDTLTTFMDAVPTWFGNVTNEIYDFARLVDAAVCRYRYLKPLPAVVARITAHANNYFPDKFSEDDIADFCFMNYRMPFLQWLATNDPAYAAYKTIPLDMGYRLGPIIQELPVNSTRLSNVIHSVRDMPLTWKESVLYKHFLAHLKQTLESKIVSNSTDQHSLKLMACWNRHFPDYAIFVAVFPAAHPRMFQ